jgi:hypothetical protein
MPDPIRDPEQPPVPEGSVRNQTMKPPGILPKNTQTWVIAGLATVMVAAIALSGSGSKSKAPAPLPRQGAVNPHASFRNESARNIAGPWDSHLANCAIYPILVSFCSHWEKALSEP